MIDAADNESEPAATDSPRCSWLRSRRNVSPATEHVCAWKVKENVEPFHFWLSTFSNPPINSTKCLLTYKPSPVPPCFAKDVEVGCANRWNNSDISAFSSPQPVSRTAILK